MKSATIFLLFVAVGCAAATAITTPVNNALAPRQANEVDLFASARKVIEQLVETIRKSAQDTLDAITRFGNRVQEDAKAIRDRIASDFQRLRDRVTETIKNVRDRLVESGAGVRDCLQIHESSASAIFNDTVAKTMTCVSDRIEEVGKEITDIRATAHEGMDFANRALEGMKRCTAQNEGLLATGTCLGAIVVEAEMKAISYAGHTALTIGRINLAVATLPASLEVCAGTRVVSAGIETSRLLMEVGACSAANVFSAMAGNVEFQSDTF